MKRNLVVLYIYIYDRMYKHFQMDIPALSVTPAFLKRKEISDLEWICLTEIKRLILISLFLSGEMSIFQ